METINTFIQSVVRSKTIPDSRPNGQSVYPFSDQNGAKTIPDGAAHLYGLYEPLPRAHKKWSFTFSILFLKNSFHFKKRFYQFCKRRLSWFKFPRLATILRYVTIKFVDVRALPDFCASRLL